MASSCPSPHAKFSFECRPKLLKDFLQDESPSYSSNISFQSHPQKAYKSTSQRFLNKNSSQLHRSRSSRAASATISAIHKVINIVKFLPFTYVKSPSILPRSISRKLSRRNHKETENYILNHEVSVTVKVKVKDILRWKSSKDLVEEKSTPLDYAHSPFKCDFTAENLSSWCGEIDECYGKRNLLEEGVGGCCVTETRGIKLDPKEHYENEQHSPVSVLESPFREDQDEYFSFHRTLVDTDRRKCMLRERIQAFESLEEGNTSFNEEDEEIQEQETHEIEENAKKLLSHFKETEKLCTEDCEANVDQLLLDFFWHELIQNNVDESEILMKEAKSLINGEYNDEFEWENEDKREAYIRDMQELGRWNYKFEEEKEELALDLEFEVLTDLVHEVLVDFFALNR
ncbi:uncharacterized protein LOC107786461 [Nicotiana tabacum]|uniref:Uncharacterized protein LOC107786461 n=1 Tax=Nicotiana tabacum TaxID=4097 RepID=A0A1S3ZGM8_TOBAC|nr:PREDICTED: uncharacterized protein LOC107786461 [Nicotiana tabacum]